MKQKTMPDIMKVILLLFDQLFEDQIDPFFYTDEWTTRIKKMTDIQFHDNFRMSRSIFKRLQEKINSETTENITERDPLIFLFFVSHVQTYRKMRENMGQSHATVFRTIRRVAEVLHSIAKSEIKFPSESEYADLKDGFLEFSDVYGCVLAIDGTHIPITRPKGGPFNYYNRMGFFSINMLCLLFSGP